MYTLTMDQVQNHMDTHTRKRYIQSLQVIEANLPTKSTIKSNGKYDCQTNRQNNDEGT